jgi:hypothetical protein
LTLDEDEYLTSFTSRTGAWFDQLCFKTNKGRELKCGSTGGSPKESVFEGNPCIVCFEGDCYDWLHNVKAYYVDLDQVSSSMEDPVLKLIADSDLLSRGLDPQYSNLLEERTLTEIKECEKRFKIDLINSNAIEFAKKSNSFGADEAKMIMDDGLSDSDIDLDDDKGNKDD